MAKQEGIPNYQLLPRALSAPDNTYSSSLFHCFPFSQFYQQPKRERQQQFKSIAFLSFSRYLLFPIRRCPHKRLHFEAQSFATLCVTAVVVVMPTVIVTESTAHFCSSFRLSLPINRNCNRDCAQVEPETKIFNQLRDLSQL